jgi:ketosteroid isomerase-like protein/quercetin dioxygenase-like cupin family protein
MTRWVLVLGLGAMLSGACSSSVNVEQEREALLARDREWASATADPDKFVTYLAADASMYPPGAPALTGRDAIRTAYKEMASAPGFALQWTPTRAEVGSSGDVGVTVGTYESKSSAGVERGKYVTVWEKEGGTWMATDDIFNADGPPPVAHAMVAPATLKWGDSPPGLPAGARVAVVSGDPSAPGPFVLRAQVPAGYRVPPHWHPTAENLTVLSGTVALGMGDTMDDKTMTTLAAGGYAVLPADMRHSFAARTAATFQIHGSGPFAISYVNAADDPRNK